jgi:hypothetical protein
MTFEFIFLSNCKIKNSQITVWNSFWSGKLNFIIWDAIIKWYSQKITIHTEGVPLWALTVNLTQPRVPWERNCLDQIGLWPCLRGAPWLLMGNPSHCGKVVLGYTWKLAKHGSVSKPAFWALFFMLSHGLDCSYFLQHQTSAFYCVLCSSIQMLPARPCPSPQQNLSRSYTTCSSYHKPRDYPQILNSLRQALFSIICWLWQDGPLTPFWQTQLSFFFFCVVTRLPRLPGLTDHPSIDSPNQTVSSVPKLMPLLSGAAYLQVSRPSHQTSVCVLIKNSMKSYSKESSVCRWRLNPHLWGCRGIWLTACSMSSCTIWAWICIVVSSYAAWSFLTLFMKWRWYAHCVAICED